MKKPDPKTLASLNVRIAELMGWTDIKQLGGGNNWRWVGDPPKATRHEFVPDFTGSLDAIAAAEDALIGTHAEGWRICDHAIPAWQRAIALDRTLSPHPIVLPP